MFRRSQVRWRCQELLHPHRPKPDDWLPPHMGASPPAGPTLGTRHPTPMRHIITVTPRIAEASLFTLHPRITAIGTADPDTGITAGITAGNSRAFLMATDVRLDRGFYMGCSCRAVVRREAVTLCLHRPRSLTRNQCVAALRQATRWVLVVRKRLVEHWRFGFWGDASSGSDWCSAQSEPRVGTMPSLPPRAVGCRRCS